MSIQVVPPLLAGIPAGGTTNQVLAKTSGTDFAAAWVAPGGGGLTIPLSQNLTFSPDATYDIGASSSTLRPRDVWVGRDLAANKHLTVGYMGATFAGAAMLVQPKAADLSGTTQYQFLANGFLGAGVTGSAIGVSTSNNLPAATATTESANFYASGHGIPVGSSVTNAYGLYVYAANQARATNVYGVYILGPTGGSSNNVGIQSDAQIRVGTGGALGYRGQLYPTNGGAPGMNVLAYGDTTYLTLGSGLDTMTMTNGWHDGTGWVRMTDGQPMTLFEQLRSSFNFYYAPAASGAPAWGLVGQIDSGGSLSMSAHVRAGQVLISTNGQLNLENNGNTIYMGSTADSNSALNSWLQIRKRYDAATIWHIYGTGEVLMYGPLTITRPSGVIPQLRFGDGNNQIQETGNVMYIDQYSGNFIFRGSGYSWATIVALDYPNGLVVKGAAVGNGVYCAAHGAYYGGVYYSTSNQFLAWPSQTSHKRDIRPFSRLGKLWARSPRGVEYRQLQPEWKKDYECTWHEPEPDAPLQFGFLAEDWEEDFPELVVDGPGGVKAFNTVGLVPILWEAVRALRAEVQTLKEARA